MPEADLQAQPDAPDANVNQLTEEADAPKEPTENEAEPSPAPDDAGDKPKKPHWASKRIDELTRQVRETERRELALLDALRARHGEEVPAKEKAPEPAKTLADFGWDEGKFQDYVKTSLVELTRTEAVAAAKAELSRERERQAKIERSFDHAEREEKFSETVPDYHEVTRARDLAITETMAETIHESENGPAIAYHLGKNPRLAERISQLPALQQAREIGRIEAKLEKPQAPKVSSAPAPAPKIAATEHAVNAKPDSPESDQLSDEAWLKARNKQVSRRS